MTITMDINSNLLNNSNNNLRESRSRINNNSIPDTSPSSRSLASLSYRTSCRNDRNKNSASDDIRALFHLLATAASMPVMAARTVAAVVGLKK